MDRHVISEDLEETIARAFNYHFGTCDSCGNVTTVGTVPYQNRHGSNDEYVCAGCLAAIVDGRKQIGR
jgi:hydrogenase maturation factor HypF (carbamoyltransferase family)